MASITLRTRNEKRTENVSVISNKREEDYTKKAVLTEIDEQLIAEKVIGALRTENCELCVVMKWRNKSEADVIPSRIANVRWPHLVIRYYEQRIRWIDV